MKWRLIHLKWRKRNSAAGARLINKYIVYSYLNTNTHKISTLHTIRTIYVCMSHIFTSHSALHMDIGQFVQAIKSLQSKKVKKKPATATSKLNCFYKFMWELEEKFWTGLIFLLLFIGAFLYFSGQSFVLTDEMILYQHSQRVAFESLKESLGMQWDNYDETVEEARPTNLILLELKWRKKKLIEAEEFLSINKLIDSQRYRIKYLKAQRSQKSKPEIDHLTNCENIDNISRFKTCFSNEILFPSVSKSSNRQAYSNWIETAFTELLTEITSKLKETLEFHARIMKRFANRRDVDNHFVTSQRQIIAIKTLLNTAITEIEAIPAHTIETFSHVKSSFTKNTEKIISEHYQQT